MHQQHSLFPSDWLKAESWRFVHTGFNKREKCMREWQIHPINCTFLLNHVDFVAQKNMLMKSKSFLAAPPAHAPAPHHHADIDDCAWCPRIAGATCSHWWLAPQKPPVCGKILLWILVQHTSHEKIPNRMWYSPQVKAYQLVAHFDRR